MGTLVKDQGSVHSPDTVAHKPFATPFREVLMPCSDLPGQQAWMWSHTHMYTTHTHSYIRWKEVLENCHRHHSWHCYILLCLLSVSSTHVRTTRWEPLHHIPLLSPVSVMLDVCGIREWISICYTSYTKLLLKYWSTASGPLPIHMQRLHLQWRCLWNKHSNVL